MKSGTMYATQVKEFYAKFRKHVETPEIPEPDDPLRCLAIGVVGSACPESEAEAAIDGVLSTMVDWNEIRVSRPFEVLNAMGDSVPCGLPKVQNLLDALQSVYNHENCLSLDRLKGIGRREARHYLDSLSGVDEYAAAMVLLWSLGGHAIPVNDRLLEALRSGQLVYPSAPRAEVQAFLERHISASQAKEFCLVMRSFSPKKRAGVKSGQAAAGGGNRQAAS